MSRPTMNYERERDELTDDEVQRVFDHLHEHGITCAHCRGKLNAERHLWFLVGVAEPQHRFPIVPLLCPECQILDFYTPPLPINSSN